jgi:hypothetical protein
MKIPLLPFLVSLAETQRLISDVWTVMDRNGGASHASYNPTFHCPSTALSIGNMDLSKKFRYVTWVRFSTLAIQLQKVDALTKDSRLVIEG